MAEEFDGPTRSAALALMAQYGHDAEVIAVMRAAEYAALGDSEGLAAWDDIIACISRLQSEAPGDGSLN